MTILVYEDQQQRLVDAYIMGEIIDATFRAVCKDLGIAPTLQATDSPILLIEAACADTGAMQ